MLLGARAERGERAGRRQRGHPGAAEVLPSCGHQGDHRVITHFSLALPRASHLQSAGGERHALRRGLRDKAAVREMPGVPGGGYQSLDITHR